MKVVRLSGNIVAEIIPDYALPVEKWYGKEFAALCVEAPDDVEQHWVMNDDGSFSPPHVETAETEETNEEDNEE